MKNEKNQKMLANFLGVAGVLCVGGCELYDKKYHLLTCTLAENNAVEHFCVPQKYSCELGAARTACSWNHFGELGKNEEFTEALWSLPCPEGTEQGSLPPSNLNDCGGESPASAGASASNGGSGGSTGETGDATGDPTEGMEDPVWLCSLRSPGKCADVSPDDALAALIDGDPYPANPLLDVCWAPIELDPLPAKKISKCVRRPNQAGAIIACEEDCKALNKSIQDKCVEPDCVVVNAIDCVLDGNVNGLPDSLELPKLLSEVETDWRCADGFDSVPAWEGSSIVLFGSSGSLVVSDGHSAGMTSVEGYLGYTLTNCTDESCTITIDALESVSRHAEGGYTNAAGGGGVFGIERLGFRSRNAFSGLWNKTRGTVSFPAAIVEAQFWADMVYIDGLPVWGGVRVTEIDQIVGSLRSAAGPLTLNLSHNLPEANVTVSLTTR